MGTKKTYSGNIEECYENLANAIVQQAYFDMLNHIITNELWRRNFKTKRASNMFDMMHNKVAKKRRIKIGSYEDERLIEEFADSTKYVIQSDFRFFRSGWFTIFTKIKGEFFINQCLLQADQFLNGGDKYDHQRIFTARSE